jgi:Kef-type K+ transport system membrane component KefB
LIAGVILGPSIFGQGVGRRLPLVFAGRRDQSGALFAVSWLGVALLSSRLGFETDLGLIRRLGRAAALVDRLLALVVPLVGGLVVGEILPEEFVGAES